MDSFTAEEQTIILELARYALADASIYDFMARELDLSDSVLYALREKLQTITKGCNV